MNEFYIVAFDMFCYLRNRYENSSPIKTEIVG